MLLASEELHFILNQFKDLHQTFLPLRRCMKQVSILSRMTAQIYLYLTNVFRLHELWSIVLGPQVARKGGGLQNCVNENDQHSFIHCNQIQHGVTNPL